MAEKELKIRDFCGDYALDIPTDLKGSIITLYFNSRRNAENVKRIIEIDGSKPNEAPVCDMQEVRHGKWLYEDSDIGWTDYKCSDCGNIISTVAQDEDLYSFCPYCGAKMDKE